jgi:hypothetical protein
VSGEVTRYGFTYGAANVERIADLDERGVAIGIKTPYRAYDVIVSPTGRSVRFYDRRRKCWLRADAAEGER